MSARPVSIAGLTKGWPKIGKGAYGTVYGRGDFVIKHAVNDGTRTYLEWVIQRTLEGRRMRGMPWVEWLQDDGDSHYIVKMRRYRSLSTVTPPDSTALSSGSVHRDPDAPRYLELLIEEFTAETGVSANDMHHGNVMGDDNHEWIVTDPSYSGYKPLVLH